MLRCCSRLAGLSLLTCAWLHGSEFTVASVRLDPSPGSGIHRLDPVSGTVSLLKHGLRDYIRFAWELREEQVIGGPGWLDSDVYAIAAKAAPGTSEAELRLMLQGLLIERFGLKFRREDRAVAGYALVVGKKGLKLTAADVGGPAGSGKPMIGHGHFMGVSTDMGQLARVLATITGRPVVDRSGVSGVYAVTLEWDPDDGGSSRKEGAPDALRPSIFTAVQEQLGLTLQPARSSVSYLVIEGVRRPSEN